MSRETVEVVVKQRGAREVKRSIEDIGEGARKADGFVGMLKKTLGTLAVGETLRRATMASLEFSDALAEVSTLLSNDLDRQMTTINEQARLMAVQFGSMPTEQAKAFYQAISAGADDATQATALLDAANRLAVGGVTDITTAADGLTSLLNAYEIDASRATEVTDSLFVAMRAGKTTIGELSSNLGKVAPLTSQVGVSIDEMNAAVAALTKGGINTTEAITGLRAILAAVVKPGQEALDVSKSLGLEFNSAAVRAKGFTGFLEDVAVKTGGNTDALAKLFGGVEAIIPALALAGAAGVSFNEIMAQMENKTGATAEAFEKIASAPGFKLRQLMAATKVVMIDLGDAIATVLAPAMGWLAENFETVKKAAIAAGAGMAVAFGPTLVGYLKTATAAMRLFTIAIMANPIGALATLVTAGVTALILFQDELTVSADGVVTLGDYATATWEMISDGAESMKEAVMMAWATMTNTVNSLTESIGSQFGWTALTMGAMMKNTVNGYIGLWVGLYDSVVAIFEGIGPAIDDLFTQALNGLIALAETGLNKLVGLANEVREFAGLDPLGVLDIGRLERETSGAAADLGSAIRDAFKDSLSTDYLGAVTGVFDTLQKRARAIAEERRATAGSEGGSGDVPGIPSLPNIPGLLGADGAGQAAKKQADELDRLLNALDPVRAAALEVAEAQALLEAAFGDTGEGARKKARYLELLVDKYKDQLDPLGAVNRELDRELTLSGMLDDERRVASRLMETEQRLREDGIRLADAEREALEAKLEAIEKLNDETLAQQNLLRQINGPAKDYAAQLQAIKTLLDDGRIAMEDYTQALRTNRINFLQSQTDEMSGYERGVLRVKETVTDLATQTEATVINGFNNMEDAVVKFVKTGELNLHSFFSGILEDTTRTLFRAGTDSLLGLFGGGDGLGAMLGGSTGSEAIAASGAQFSSQVNVAGTTFMSQVQAAGTAFATSVQSGGIGARGISGNGAAGIITGPGTQGELPDFGGLYGEVAGVIEQSGTTVAERLKGAFQSGGGGFLNGLTGIFGQLGSALGGLLGGGGGGGGFASMLGSLGSMFGGGGFGLGGLVGSMFAGGFATGGAFTVPGSGTPDSKLVSMALTPGERVTIETPEQQKSKSAQAPAPQVNVTPRIINVTDPREALAALDSAEGEQTIMNVIERNPETVRRLLGAN